MHVIYIAYPSSLTLHAANAVQTYHTARELKQLDPRAVLLIPRLPGRPSAFAAIGATHLPRLPVNVLNHLVRTTLWSYLERTWFAGCTALWLLGRGRAGPATVVYVRDAVVAAWYGALLRRLLGVQVVYEIHDLEQWNPSRARSPALAPLVRLIDSAAVRGATRVVTLTHAFREYLVRVGLKRAEEVGAVPDGYDDAVYAPGPTAEARQALGLPSDVFVAAYSGFTFAYRQVDSLVRAWPVVRRAVPSAMLCLVGGRPTEVERLRALVEALGVGDAVQLTGLQPPTTVARYLAAADALVIPGTVSGLNASPLKLFEYMAMHRPIICADLPALREILGDDGALYVPTGDAEALARGLVALAQDDALARRLAARAGALSSAYTYQARARAVLNEIARVVPAGGQP